MSYLAKKRNESSKQSALFPRVTIPSSPANLPLPLRESSFPSVRSPGKSLLEKEMELEDKFITNQISCGGELIKPVPIVNLILGAEGVYRAIEISHTKPSAYVLRKAIDRWDGIESFEGE